MDTIQIEGWRMSILHDGEVRSEFTAFSQVLQAGGAAYPAEVPGNFELDLMRAGVITRSLPRGRDFKIAGAGGLPCFL
ncbi:MAG: hypothetical protein ACLR23_08250 [Clostridia bacterium]